MTTKSSIVALTASFLVLSVASVSAQTSTSTTTTGTHHKTTAHTTAMSKNPHVKGATGSTVVKGDQSTVAGDKAATVEQKSGQLAK